MFDRFTDASRKVMGLARQEAERLDHQYIGTEHILLGVILEGTSGAAEVLGEVGADLEQLRAQVVAIVESGESSFFRSAQLPFTPRARRSLETAAEQASGHGSIGPEHLLLGVLGEDEGVATQALRNVELRPHRIRDGVLARLSGAPPAPRPEGLGGL